MPLSPRSRLGAYEILAALGAGGMGEVYRARDTRLGREVAIKILPESLADDPDRLVRFEREARTLAALNHPHIAQLYELADFGDTRALVMELVEGEDLHERLTRGPIPTTDAIAIAGQIAEALQAAHERGIVHRDLKPANVKVRPDGTAKVLDFGLAKPAGTPFATMSDSVTSSPTGTAPVTMPGAVLGTVAYMAPEQARGQDVDRRADVWAFGCVLYEMLTGRRAFQGSTPGDVIAHILTGEPDWDALPAGLPDGVLRVLRRSLEKHVHQRLQDAGDARLDLDDTPIGMTATPPRRRHGVIIGTAATVAVVSALVAGMALGRRGSVPSAAPLIRASVLLPPGHRFEPARRAVAISTDGRQLLHSSREGLHVRPLDEFTARLIPGTAGAINAVFSPDGLRVAAWELQGIRVLDPLTGSGTTLKVPPVNLGGVLPSLSWDDRGLLVSLGVAGVYLYPPGATEPRRLLDPAPDEAVSSAQLLPGADHVLMTVFSRSPSRPGAAAGTIIVQPLASAERVMIVESGSDARYVPSGHIIYAADGTLFAVEFDPTTRQVGREPTPIVEGVRATNVINATTHYAVSNTGTLAYVPGQRMPPALALDLVRTDRTGNVRFLHLPPAPYEAPRVSPDGTLVAMSTDDGKDAQIWVHDLSQPMSVRKLTLVGRNRFPVWGPDGRRIAYQSTRDGRSGIFSQAADGSDAAIEITAAEEGSTHTPESWSPDGSTLLFAAATAGTHQLWRLHLPTRRAERFGDVASRSPTAATFSPNGRWVAYNTMLDTGFHATFVQPFPPTGAVYQVSSNDDGHHPMWSRDGRELFYIPGPGRLAVVTVSSQGPFSFSRATLLPPAGLMGPGTVVRSQDVLMDGQSFIGRQVAEDEDSRLGAPQRIQLVTDWLEELRRRRSSP